MLSDFTMCVLKKVSHIPKGKVVSYGQIAAACGHPRAARQVGGILRSLNEQVSIPWWRVINNSGKISIKGNFLATKEMQKNLLIGEGVEVSDAFQLEIVKYRHNLL